VTGGLTFTFGGLSADVEARVLDSENNAIEGLYAAGEIVGDFFYHNYPSGSSLVRSTVYGRIAGTNAAAEATRRATAAVTMTGTVDAVVARAATTELAE
jgi:tricarballylate dehydrogenase